MPKPDDSRIVVCNATPIIALGLIDRIDLLPRLYGGIVIPEAVRREIQAGADPSLDELLDRASWLRVMALRDPTHATVLSDLDRGEAEVIAIALENSARLVIIDERLGRTHAKRLGLPLTGTLGVLLRGKERGLLGAVGPLVSQLRDRGFWVSGELLAEVITLANEPPSRRP